MRFQNSLRRFHTSVKLLSTDGAEISKNKLVQLKWSVVPQLRGRSEFTNRVWINRFIIKQKALKSGQPIIEGRYTEEYLAFKSDPGLLEEYINVYGHIRFGKILEDLDAMAGSVAYAHCDDLRDDTPPLTIVTASLDRIDLLRNIPTTDDIKICGFVSYVGRSSMEISIFMEIVPEGYAAVMEKKVSNEKQFPWIHRGKDRENVLLSAKFTMVARNPVDGKSVQVNQLSLETDEERRLFKLGAEQKSRKQVQTLTSFEKKPPTYEEMTLLHELYLEYRQYLDPSYHIPKPAEVVWMKDTIKQNLLICMPQHRNIHGNIFGGYLMRVAYELAFTTSTIFAKTRPNFTSLDDIVFKKPVPIGSFLSLTSQIVYTDMETNSFQVKVKADVINPTKDYQDQVDNTNIFWFRFKLDDDIALQRVIPRSYDESIRYLEGKRRSESYENNLRNTERFFNDHEP
ncbi:Acyl-coenzyme A thioesterase 9, mitochondrial [Clydaea vesicula]|uniref:Acyl-coenzyme A thioesterase 9, mitochondrial n=1 Tax=Clydaea vesicula TaxID=447962 RepID=A0AAD5TZ78_9FUNG|nr:Acyl-coenzyme A thioesterase 9, mitochondrial [Clydaea vesicula]